MRADVLLLVLAACDGDADGPVGEPMDCAWLESGCWTAVAAVLEDCALSEDDAGILADDFATCTYGSGATVNFDPALASLPWGGAPDDWGFDIQPNAPPCMTFTWSSGVTTAAWTVGSAAGAFEITIVGGEATAICPDESRWRTADWTALLAECGASEPGIWPETTTDTISATMVAGSSETPLFSCERATARRR